MNKGINLGFRPIVNGPDKDLARQTTFFESNVAAALTEVENQAQPKGTPTPLQTTACTAQEEDILSCAGTFTVTLPTANAQNAGRKISIIVRSGTITVKAFSGQVQGVATDTIPAIGLFEYTSDGVGWWRPGGVTSVTAGSGLTGGGTGAVTIAAGSSLITDTSLTAITELFRRELENVRLLAEQLVDLEIRTPPPPNI